VRSTFALGDTSFSAAVNATSNAASSFSFPPNDSCLLSARSNLRKKERFPDGSVEGVDASSSHPSLLPSCVVAFRPPEAVEAITTRAVVQSRLYTTDVRLLIAPLGILKLNDI